MKKRMASIALSIPIIFSCSNVCYADTWGNFSKWYYVYDDYDWGYGDYDWGYDDWGYDDWGYDNSQYLTPVITSPKSYDTILSTDEILITWKYAGSDTCVVLVRGEGGYYSEIVGESGNKARIAPNKLAKGCSYTIEIKAGDKISEPLTINIADKKEEIVEIVSRTPVEKAEERISTEKVTPDGAFDNKESADKFMKTVNVKVWKLNANNQKVTETIPITVNAALADTVVKIFNEIYQNELHFPIKSASCYNYRTTASGRLSEHALGTAIDINPNENYCVYSNGTTVGSFYEPYQNSYSVVPEIINIFRKYNFHWGGSFGDYMHFSYFST